MVSQRNVNWFFFFLIFSKEISGITRKLRCNNILHCNFFVNTNKKMAILTGCLQNIMFPRRANKLLLWHKKIVECLPTDTCKLLEQYTLSLRRTGNVKSPGAEGVTCIFHFMLQGHATQLNTRKGWQGKKQCLSIRTSVALPSELFYAHYL